MEQPISKTAIIKAVPDQVSCALGEETVVLQLKAGTYFGLNEVGTRVWNLVLQPRTVQEVEQTLLDEYEVEPAKCESDLQKLLKELQAAKLIEIQT